MELISSGISVFGDLKSSLFRCRDGRFIVYIYPVDRSSDVKARCEWLSREDAEEWTKAHQLRPA